MMNPTGEEYIQDLLRDPTEFNRRGRAYELLEKYFDGLSLESLRPLLKHQNQEVRHAAVWIAAELGDKASELLHEIVPLIDDSERFIRYYALESVMTCSIGQRSGHFVCVLRSLSSEDEVIRVLAMRLISNASRNQIESALQVLDRSDELASVHARGLDALRDESSIGVDQVKLMLGDDHPLIRKYGAIAAKRLRRLELLEDLRISKDRDIREFAREFAAEAP